MKSNFNIPAETRRNSAESAISSQHGSISPGDSQINSSDSVFIDRSNIPGAGRGVFARRFIAADEIIEICPIVRVSTSDPAIASGDSIVRHYVFSFAEGYEGFALGFGSLYNHSYDPNALYTKDHFKQAVVFRARFDIAKGSEITVSYNNSDPSDKSTPMNNGVPPVGG